MRSLIFLLLFSSQAFGALIERDLFFSGDGLLTYDESSNLEWLDWSETAGITVDEIRSGYGNWLASGFRFADRSEVMNLIYQGGMTPHLSNSYWQYSTEEYIPAINLNNLLDTGQQPKTCGDAHWPIGDTNRIDILNICAVDNEGVAVIFKNYSDSNSARTEYGNALVRNPVPLPAGIYLFLSGLVGLGLMRGRNG